MLDLVADFNSTIFFLLLGGYEETHTQSRR